MPGTVLDTNDNTEYSAFQGEGKEIIIDDK